MRRADRVAVLDQRILLQVGSPLKIYNHPRNVFVARFIGSPGMNLLPGRLGAENGQTFVDLGSAGRTGALPSDLARAAERAKSAEVLVGVRPEDLECVDD